MLGSVSALAALLMPLPAAAFEAGTALSISTSGREDEQAAAEQLHRLTATYDLAPFIYTDKVVMDWDAIPHSHPVLTLNTKYLDNDRAQLATFLHEQMHWYVLRDRKALYALVEELESVYPEVPVGNREGAKDEWSTYLHLVVNRLELDAVESLLGEEAAREVAAEKRVYKWIYRTVVDDRDSLTALIRKYGFEILDPA